MRQRSFLSLLTELFGGVPAQPTLQPRSAGELAVELDRLAGGIHTLVDARALVDFVVARFAPTPAQGWGSHAWLDRLARAEFVAVSDSGGLIPEERVARAWNGYIRTIGAPDTSQVTVEEVHSLRDGLFTTARIFGERRSANPWTVTSIYATTAEGGLAPGCRVVESARLLWDMANMPENLTGARERVGNGIVLSEQLRHTVASSAGGSRCVVGSVRGEDPVRKATREYIRDKGQRALNRAIRAMMDQTLA